MLNEVRRSSFHMKEANGRMEPPSLNSEEGISSPREGRKKWVAFTLIRVYAKKKKGGLLIRLYIYGRPSRITS